MMTNKSNELPETPIAYDAYRHWDRWSQLRIGVRATMRSTRDRSGGNETVCGNHFLYQESADSNVVADIEGAGILYFWRANFWHGSPWLYEIDGETHRVEETATACRMEAHSYRWEEEIPPHHFIPEKQFPEPLALTWVQNHGSDLSWVPIPFENSFRMAYSKTSYGTGYGIFHTFLPGIPLSQPLKAFDWNADPDPEAIALFNAAGTDIAPQDIHGLSGTVDLLPACPNTIVHLKDSAGQLRAIHFSISREQAVDFGSCWLKITWDDRDTASIDCPLSLFFGAANLYNRDDREWLVKAIPVHIRFTPNRCELGCYFPMPFFHAAKIELISRSSQPLTDVQWNVRYETDPAPTQSRAYFHAGYADFPQPKKGDDLVLLDTRHAEGGGDWTGHIVGTTFTFTRQNYLRTLEGIPRFFFDGAKHPQGYGTGTEEWGGGGDYWGGRNTTLPLAGHPCGHNKPSKIKKWNGEETIFHQNPIELTHSAYRFLLADLMPFGKNARVQLEHGGENETLEHYESLTYWYGLPAASLHLCDTLNVGDISSEQDHDYAVTQGSDPCEINSRYEWGVDHLDGQEIYPAHTEKERHHRGESHFRLRIQPQNIGVLLRRTCDYLYPNQRAEIWIRHQGEWASQGFWYSPGSTTSVLAQPPTNKWKAEAEEEDPVNEERTVNRRFYETEFMIGKEWTQNKEYLEIKAVFSPRDKDLWPGHPFPEKSAWSEIRYDAYCFTLPDFNPLRNTHEN